MRKAAVYSTIESGFWILESEKGEAGNGIRQEVDSEKVG